MKLRIALLIALLLSLIGCASPPHTQPISPSRPPSTQPAGAPPIPVVLLTGHQSYPEGLPVPKEITKPLSGGVPIFEKDVTLEPYGEPGAFEDYEFPYLFPNDANMFDIVIQISPVQGNSFLRLSTVADKRGTIWCGVTGLAGIYEIERLPIAPFYRRFYWNQETRVETPGRNYSVHNAALRVVAWKPSYTFQETAIFFGNSSDDPARVTYKIYDAGVISDFQQFYKWFQNLQSLSQEERSKALASLNLERTYYWTLIG